MRPLVYERDTTQRGFWYWNQANNPYTKDKYGSKGVSLGELYDLLHKKLNYFHAKIVQAEDKGSLLTLLRRSLFYAKIAQAEDKGSLLTLLRRSLSYAKIVQAEDKGSLLTLLRRSLSYAKIQYF